MWRQSCASQVEHRFAEIAKENLDHAAQMDASLARRRAEAGVRRHRTQSHLTSQRGVPWTAAPAAAAAVGGPEAKRGGASLELRPRAAAHAIRDRVSGP